MEIDIDLDKLEQECTNLRKLCGRSSFPGDACVKGRECEPCRERAKSADIIEKLVRHLRAAEADAALYRALRKCICTRDDAFADLFGEQMEGIDGADTLDEAKFDEALKATIAAQGASHD